MRYLNDIENVLTLHALNSKSQTVFFTSIIPVHIKKKVKSNKLFQNDKKEKKILTWLGICVDYIRQLIGQPEGFSFVMTITGTAVLANVFGLILT